MLVERALTPGLSTFSIPWSSWWRAVALAIVSNRLAHRDSSTSPCRERKRGKLQHFTPTTWVVTAFSRISSRERRYSQTHDTSQTLACLVTVMRLQREASGLHGPLCTSRQEDNAVTQGLGWAYCGGKTSWKISTQKWVVEVWVKLNVPNML